MLKGNGHIICQQMILLIIVFEEDDNVVEMEVDGNDFQSEQSEGEITEDSGEESTEDRSSSDEDDGRAECYESSQEKMYAKWKGSSGHDGNHKRVRSRRSQSRSRSRSCVRDRTRARSREHSRESRRSLEMKLDCMGNALELMQNIMMKQVMLGDNDGKAENKQAEANTAKSGENLCKSVINSNSDTTIYNNALEQVPEDQAPKESVSNIGYNTLVVDSEISLKIPGKVNGRESSSSEDQVDTSDELIEVDCDKFIADCQAQAEKQSRSKHTSGENQVGTRDTTYPSDRMIQEAEQVWAKVFSNPGKTVDHTLNSRFQANNTNIMVTSAMDEEYLVIGGHVDSNLQQKIIDFEYVDFARLLPKDRITKLDNHRFKLVVRGGSTFFSPVSEHESTNIVNFSKWEQAFRIYSNVLTRAYPGKASELIQYNHIIYMASLSFAWENVYNYDQEFRIYIS